MVLLSQQPSRTGNCWNKVRIKLEERRRCPGCILEFVLHQGMHGHQIMRFTSAAFASYSEMPGQGFAQAQPRFNKRVWVRGREHTPVRDWEGAGILLFSDFISHDFLKGALWSLGSARPSFLLSPGLFPRGGYFHRFCLYFHRLCLHFHLAHPTRPISSVTPPTKLPDGLSPSSFL